jgi:hypothetical protein
VPEPIGDFWPSDVGQSTIRTPGAILKEAASYLGPKTKQMVKADVLTNTGNDGRFIQSFVLNVPALDNYKYLLFTVYHPILLYPLTLVWKDIGITITSEEALIAKVKEILGSDETKKAIQALLAQVSGLSAG